MPFGHQGNHLGFTHARRTPQHDGGVLAMEGSLKFAFEYG
jgi:hypothetical protein